MIAHMLIDGGSIKYNGLFGYLERDDERGRAPPLPEVRDHLRHLAEVHVQSTTARLDLMLHLRVHEGVQMKKRMKGSTAGWGGGRGEVPTASLSTLQCHERHAAAHAVKEKRLQWPQNNARRSVRCGALYDSIQWDAMDSAQHSTAVVMRCTCTSSQVCASGTGPHTIVALWASPAHIGLV